VWKVVEIKAEKVGIAKAEGGGAKGRRGKEARRKRKSKGQRKKERKKAGSTKDSRRMGDLGRRREGSEIRSGSKEADSREVS